jgi:formylglycine-generating enzyme required for sulfatase activity
MTNKRKSIRGDSWYGNSYDARASNRDLYGLPVHDPFDRDRLLGFRCVRGEGAAYRSSRGGSWNFKPQLKLLFSGSASIRPWAPRRATSDRHWSIGFRCVRSTS